MLAFLTEIGCRYQIVREDGGLEPARGDIEEDHPKGRNFLLTPA